MKIKNVAKVLVFNELDQVLLLRRSNTDNRRPGEWDFPGGGVERGENFAPAAARELREEAGITVQKHQLSLLYAATEYYRPRRESVTRMLFYTRIDSALTTVTLSFEHDEYVWVSPEQVLKDFPHPFYATGLRYGLKHHLLA